MRKIIRNWNEAYFKTFQETRLLSQIVSFSIAIMIALMFADFIYRISQVSEFSAELLESIIKNIINDLFVFLLFGSRFLLLFSKRKTLFWLSQIIWLVVFTTLLSQFAPPEFGGCTKNMLPIFGETLSYVFVAYLIFSPLRQFITLLVSIVRIFVK